MAKKGVAQLQAELSTNEDFDLFLDKNPDALLVLDIYSDWCGPCLGAVNALRKIKMELGGDALQLAIVKCDNITKLQRFYKKSEPSWLFLRGGKSVNLLFGSNIPKLLDLIRIELNFVGQSIEKRFYVEIDELHPEEQRREQIKNDKIAAIALKERLEREKKRRDYLMFCTDAILENLPDIGVTVFGPQVSRDMFKKVNGVAEEVKLSIKDKRYQFVTKEDFETVNFACSNPLPPDVIEELTKQEILICFWKIEEGDGNVPRAMQRYIHELTKRHVEPADEYNPEERIIPAVIEPIKLKVPFEVDDHVICPPEDDEEELQKTRKSSVKAAVKVEDEALLGEIDFEGEEEDEGEGGEPQQQEMAFDMNLDLGDLGGDDGSQLGEEEEETGPGIDEPPPKKICMKTVKMPPVWSPNDERTQAALIYVFFRVQTLPFLVPDPPPEPPHVIMAFDTYKRRDLISIAERNKNEIPFYGFFTSDDADEAKFIANSAPKYQQLKAAPDDKLVFKVNKRTSHMMLSLASYGATYVSPTTNIGKEEALKFFPEGYKTAEFERQEALKAQQKAAEEAKKEGKDKKSAEAAPPPPEPEPEIELEGFDVEDFADMVGGLEGEGDVGEGYGAEGEGDFVGAEGDVVEVGEEEFDAALEGEAIEVE